MSEAHSSKGPPALTNLLVAVRRWEKESGAAGHWDEQSTKSTEEALGIQIPRPAPIKSPAAIDFLSTLPLVNLAQLPENHRDCEICFEGFSSIREQSENIALECAASLPCGHIIGRFCLARWVHPCKNDNTCPFCRRKLFENIPDDGTIEGLEARVALYDWLDENCKGPISPDLRMELRKATQRIAWMRLDEAYDEQFRDSDRAEQKFREDGWTDEQIDELSLKSPLELRKLRFRETLIKKIEQWLKNVDLERSVDDIKADIESYIQRIPSLLQRNVQNDE